jgi:hypothetical protein
MILGELVALERQKMNCFLAKLLLSCCTLCLRFLQQFKMSSKKFKQKLNNFAMKQLSFISATSGATGAQFERSTETQFFVFYLM